MCYNCNLPWGNEEHEAHCKSISHVLGKDLRLTDEPPNSGNTILPETLVVLQPHITPRNHAYAFWLIAQPILIGQGSHPGR